MIAKKIKNDDIYLIKIYGDAIGKNNLNDRYLLGIYACESKLNAFDCASDLFRKFLLSISANIEETSRKQAISQIQAKLRFKEDLHLLTNEELIELSQWWYCYELRSSDDPIQRTQGFMRFTDFIQAQNTQNKFMDNFPQEQSSLDFGCEKVNWQNQADFYKKAIKYKPDDPFYKANQWIISNYQRSQTILDVIRKRKPMPNPINEHIFEG